MKQYLIFHVVYPFKNICIIVPKYVLSTKKCLPKMHIDNNLLDLFKVQIGTAFFDTESAQLEVCGSDN
jgi:hypothetical protein